MGLLILDFLLLEAFALCVFEAEMPACALLGRPELPWEYAG